MPTHIRHRWFAGLALLAIGCGGVDEPVPFVGADRGPDRDAMVLPVADDVGPGEPDGALPVLDAEAGDDLALDPPDFEPLDVEVPDLEPPDLELPDGALPDIDLPDIDLPDSDLTDSDLPDVEWPDADAPDMDPPDPEGPCPGHQVLVPAGPFLYGPRDDRRELPDYCIDRTEVSAADFNACADDGGCDGYGNWARCQPGMIDENSPHQCRPDMLDHPANWIDWFRAEQFCAWAGGRLPTGEEWEKAARGPEGRDYPWGSRPLCSQGHFERGNPFDACSGVLGLPDAPVPVETYADTDSPYGAINLAGNVREWTEHRDDLDRVPPDNEPGITRGGDWRDSSEQVIGYVPNGLIAVGVSSRGHGFRCARDPIIEED